MKRIFASPGKVYLAFAMLALAGVWCALKLKVSLFPNSQQPKIELIADYVGQSSDQFRTLYGQRIEEALSEIKGTNLSIEDIKTLYTADRMRVEIAFNWGASPDQALRECKMALGGILSSMPQEMVRSVSIQPLGNDVFLGIAFTSQKRTALEVYEILHTTVLPGLRGLPDVQSADLLNPEAREISVTFDPNQLAVLRLPASRIADLLEAKLYGVSGGGVEAGGKRQMIISPASLKTVEDIKQFPVPLPGGRFIPLQSIAKVELQESLENTQLAKINGQSSLFLVVKPKPGSNLLDMSRSVLDQISAVKKGLPSDISYRIVMDPSEFITRSIKSLSLEIILGSCLASIFLFLFIGNLRNVITAAIEIPISMLIALVLMKIFDINITLFSLSGLALAAGMNVDASVVVMENIFRRVEEYKGPRSPSALLDLIWGAVREVAGPVLFSTIASLAVFIPFMMIDGFGYAMLGDLAKVVIFSHGFSAIVALILVPTVRLHMLKRGDAASEKKPPLNAILLKLESYYAEILHWLMAKSRRRLGFLVLSLLIAVGLLGWIIPRLPREIVSKPESNWIVVVLENDGSSSFKAMESISSRFESKVHDVGSQYIDFIFTWILDPNATYVMVRLKNKRDMERVRNLLRDKVQGDAETSVQVGAWNMSEFMIPEPADALITINGGDPESRLAATRDLQSRLEPMKLWSKITTQPSSAVNQRISIKPSSEQWHRLNSKGFESSFEDVMSDLRIATQGKWIGDLLIKEVETPVYIRSFTALDTQLNMIQGLPLFIGDRVLPFGTLASVTLERSPAPVFRHNGRDVSRVEARLKNADGQQLRLMQKNILKVIDDYQMERRSKKLPPLAIQMEDPDPGFNGSTAQLFWALCCSVALIFIVLLLQFNKFVDSLIVMIAVPLGLIGASVSLYLFDSTISLNSILGMTLLNGIAVNNSILLVDAIHQKENSGLSRVAAIVEAAIQRLRPILITSITTIVGMMPIAFGMGEGGKVLQPLGISVAGGLAISMALTLIFVPILQSLRRGDAAREREGQYFPILNQSEAV